MFIILNTFESILVIILILNSISYFLKMKFHNNLKEKMTTFECGFEPNHKMRLSFSLRFFTLTVLFLIFDIELTMVLCLPLITDLLLFTHFIKINSFLFLLLLLGLIFEWNQGAMKWNWPYI